MGILGNNMALPREKHVHVLRTHVSVGDRGGEGLM